MTRAEVGEILGNIDMGGAYYTSCSSEALRDGLQIGVGMRVLDIHTGKPTKVVYYRHFHEDDLKHLTEQDILNCVREQLHHLAKHEVDEYFTYKNNRIFDPHRFEKS